MNSSVGTTLAEQTERVLGIGEPRTPSRNGLAFFPLSMISYVAAPWTASPVFLAVQLALIGAGFAWVAIRRARARDRGHA